MDVKHIGFYNKTSCRSPIRKNNNVNNNVTKISILDQIITDVPPKEKNDVVIKPPVVNNDCMNNRSSCRTQKSDLKPVKNEYVYKTVTQTPSGHQTTVPTFIKFTNINMFKFNHHKVDYMNYNARKKYPYTEALTIYENNQAFYLNKFEEELDKVEYKKVLKDVEKMERWFQKIKEPKPTNEQDEDYQADLEDWQERQHFNKTHTYNYYFDKQLLPYTNYT
jgi:hypothetical protein